MRAVSAVLFDLYGTLLVYGNMDQAFRSWHRDLAVAINGAGGNVNETFVAERCRDFFSWKVPENAAFTAYEERIRKLAGDFGLSPSPEWLHETASRSMNGWQKEVTLHPGALPLLSGLRAKGIRTGVISNFEHHPHVYGVLRETGLAPLLDATLISGEVHLKKPDPRIFELALRRLGSAAAETLFVGDDPEKDIRGAAAAGLNTHLFSNGESFTCLSPLIEAA